VRINVLRTYDIYEVLKRYGRRVWLTSSFDENVAFLLSDRPHELRRIQHHQEIVPRDFSKTFRIVLSTCIQSYVLLQRRRPRWLYNIYEYRLYFVPRALHALTLSNRRLHFCKTKQTKIKPRYVLYCRYRPRNV